MTAAAPGAIAHYVAAFDAFERGLNGEKRGWVHALRRAAIERFQTQGFPTTKLEAWRYTNVAGLADIPFALAERGSLADVAEIEPVDGPRLVFVDGALAPALSRINDLPQGVSLRSLREVAAAGGDAARPYLTQLADGDGFVALNTAFWHDGALLVVERGAVVETPIHVVFLARAGGSPVASFPRLLVIAGEQSQATLVERHLHRDGGPLLAAGVAEVFLAPGARLQHVQIIEGSAQAHHVGTTRVRQDRDSHYGSHVLVGGGALSRHEVQVMLAGQGARSDLSGLYLGRGREHVDCFTLVDHAVPHTQSNELYKGVLDERAAGVFNGKVVVREGAAKADATQHNRNLLLSKGAVAHTRPQLEIYASDVKCVHGATVGQLDDNALFYLRSRGIEADAARRLLVRSFTSEVVARFPAAVRPVIEASVRARLGCPEVA